MKPQFDHTILSSFYLWFENQLLDSSIEAYKTGVANSYRYISGYNDLPNYRTYQGQYRGLVPESSVSVPNSGAFINGTGKAPNASGYVFDYQNGRIYTPLALGTGATITSINSIKEVNTYLVNDDEEVFSTLSSFRVAGDTGNWLYNKPEKLDEKIYILPACFISLKDSQNKPFSFGGEDDTKTRVNVMVVGQTNFEVDAILSKFRDSSQKTIKHVSYDSWPYGFANSLKNYPYYYTGIASSTHSSVENVRSSKVTASLVKDRLSRNLVVGHLYFDLSSIRYPRI